MSSYGENLRLTIFGRSHGPAVGMTLEGIPAGTRIDLEKLQRLMDRRAPGRNEWSSGRREPDVPVFSEGLEGGCCTGGPITAILRNQDARPEDYAALRHIPRPGHADYTAFVKYGKDAKLSGGGQFSGRMTAPLCVAGGICLQLLEQEGITVISRIAEIGGVFDRGELLRSMAEKEFPVVDDACGETMRARIAAAKAEGDSVGGVIECKVLGLPAGLGGPLFDGMESRIGDILFGIPAVKGLEFGAGFASARLTGSENNDAFCVRDGRIVTESNRCGGILGGITDGMPLCFRIAFKPTPSIAKTQKSVDLDTMTETELSVRGRHDPCIVPRAVPAVEAAAAIAVCDALLGWKHERRAEDLAALREELDRIDRELTPLFIRRMALCGKIGDFKKTRGLPILDARREEEKLRGLCALSPEELQDDVKALYQRIFELSRGFQERVSGRKRCGLLGEKLAHSYSPRIHRELAEYDYQLFERSPAELDAFLRSADWDGLNVTIPYKKTVLPYCDELSETARQIGSVNTLVRRADGTIFGDNTDAYGFSLLLQRSGEEPSGKKALVLGSGGASVMACAVLRQMGANVHVISRTGAENYENLERNRDARILVNATPVGMYPNNGTSPVDLNRLPGLELVLDLVYNPARTALLQQAEELGIPCAGGLLMLVGQAKRSAELFAEKNIDDAEIDRIAAQLSRETENIILIGMPGCGKSSVAGSLAERLKRPVLESDAEVERAAGRTIPEIFAAEGETGFRKRETEVLRELGKRSGAILSTGGGCVTREENYALLHQNGRILWLQRDLAKLPKEGRPLSQSRDLRELYREREPLYRRFADLVIEETGCVEETVEKILEVLK